MTTAAQNTENVTASLADAGPSLTAYRALAAKLGVQQSFTELTSAQHQFVQAVNANRFG
jgi:hypothetical protein